jgi:hypothetical protein
MNVIDVQSTHLGPSVGREMLFALATFPRQGWGRYLRLGKDGINLVCILILILF